MLSNNNNNAAAASSVLPLSRVPDILKRMDLNSSQAEAMKTCFGILAIMSREDSNKLLIARDGMEIILNAMTIHVDRTDVQDDLLWSLAFSNAAVKDVIAKHGGATVLVRALKRHNRSSDFLKSACGALSNMCQSKLNQEGVSNQGGLQPLVGAIHIHQTNAKLLPFIFDAIASIIVNNEDNARTVSSLGIIPIILASLSRHKTSTDVVKSGCHTLAILSDVKGQASKIAFAGGVPIILSLLDAHPLYSDLHRVAAVVLLRMLQESSHVGREITCHEGVRILLTSLEKGGAQQDTVAAVTHILYTVTNPASAVLSSVESQLWLPSTTKTVMIGEKEHDESVPGRHLTNPLLKQGSKDVVLQPTSPVVGGPAVANRLTNSNAAIYSMTQNTALGGVALIMGQYCGRRDVVRAACRLVNNLTGYNNVVGALEKINILDRMLECVHLHKETKDIVESTTSVLKIMHRRAVPVLLAHSSSSIYGLLTILKLKLPQDEDAVLACLEVFGSLLDGAEKLSAEKRRELDDSRASEGKLWEHHTLAVAVSVLDGIITEAERDSTGIGTDAASTSNSSLVKSISSALRGWSKTSTRIVAATVFLMEASQHANKLNADSSLTKDCVQVLLSLQKVMPSKNVDIHKRLEKLLPLLDSSYGQQQQYQLQLRKQVQQDKILAGRRSNKSLLPSNAESRSSENGAAGGQLTCAPGSGKVSSHDGTSDHSKRADSATPNDLSDPSDHNTDGSMSGRNRESLLIDSNEQEAATSGAAASSQSNYTSAATCERSASDAEKETAQKSYGAHFIPFVEKVSSNGVKKIFPQHPSKLGGKSAASGSNPSPLAFLGQQLLENWPNYLERLLPNSGSTSIIALSEANDFSRMHLAYESLTAAGKGLVSKCPTPIPYNVPPEGVGEPFEHTLTFDSEFESGNLLRAVQKGDAAYDLFLRSDLHTVGHTQWFYFAVANTHPADLVRQSELGVQVPPVRVRFNITNFTKPDSLFNIGMRPVVYSCVDASTKGIGWIRAGSDISYFSNSFQRNNTAGEGAANYYTLSFTIEFHNPKDTVLIAYSYPYTFADYKSHLQQILEKPGASGIIRQTKLCRTIGGEDCDLLVITNFRDKDGKDRIGPITMAATESNISSGGDLAFGTKGDANIGGSSAGLSNGSGGGASTGGLNLTSKQSSGKQMLRGKTNLKPALFLSGRVHPGETPASWMMKGILDFLTSDCSQAKLLRQVFVIFIVPILNPDGVIYGNNRCSLAGVDLNRQWKIPSKGLHPTVYALKFLMMAQRKIRDISMYVDLHGHSRKYNVFMYGCDDKKKPKPQVRAFPKFFSMHSVGRKYVCYADCSFHVKKGRESTARVVVAKEINIPCSFTLEATFCGSNYGPLKYCHMHIGHMQEVGAALCDAILNFSISEGQVKDAVVLSMVPAVNLKAVAQVEKALAELRNSDSDGMGRNDDLEDDEGSVKSKYFGSSTNLTYMFSGGNNSQVHQQQQHQQHSFNVDQGIAISGGKGLAQIGSSNVNIGFPSILREDDGHNAGSSLRGDDGPGAADMDGGDDALIENKEDVVSDESDNDIDNDQDDLGGGDAEAGSGADGLPLPDLDTVASRENNELGGGESRVNLRIKSLSAETKRNMSSTVEDAKTLSHLMPPLTRSNSKKSFAAEGPGNASMSPGELTGLLSPLSGSNNLLPAGAGGSIGSYYLNGSSLGPLKTWNSSSNMTAANNDSSSMLHSPNAHLKSFKDKERERESPIMANLFYPLSDRTGNSNSKVSKAEVAGFGMSGDLSGFGVFSSSVSGNGADQFGTHGDLTSHSVVSASASQESTKDSLFSKTKKVSSDVKKKKIATGSAFLSPNPKQASGKKSASESLMISGTQSFSPVGAAAGTATLESSKVISADAPPSNSDDFEIMDSPRNSSSAAGMKGFEAKKGSNSTIVQTDYSDSSAVKASTTNADFSNLNNINIVKAQAPATTFGLPKVNQLQIK